MIKHAHSHAKHAEARLPAPVRRRRMTQKAKDVSKKGAVTEMVPGEMYDESAETNAAMIADEEPSPP